MHRLVASASGCLLVLHMVLGCCWHHLAHASHPVGAQAEFAGADDCCCSEPHGPTPERPSHGGTAPSSCQHEQCTFTAAGPVRSSVAHELGPALALDAALPLSSPVEGCAAGILRSAAEAQLRAPSIPLRLLYSTLLI